jgi:hypothetical protein
VQFGTWRARLHRSDSGKLIPCYDNAGLLMENSTEWAGVRAYSEFTGGVFVRKPPPPPVTVAAGTEIEDSFDTEVTR